jgi:hypothetical protein
MAKVWLITASGNGLGRDIAEAAAKAALEEGSFRIAGVDLTDVPSTRLLHARS